MNIKLLLISMLFVGQAQCLKISDLTPRKTKLHLTTSVIVPCVARHFMWLSGLLEGYERQTIHPDEIVISLSEVEKLNPKEINDLEAGLWSFKLKVIRNSGVVIDGDNRTIAMDRSTGEILIFSDADDIPHPQRVEIAKYIFENYEIDHILHGICSRESFKPVKIDEIGILKFDTHQQVWDWGIKSGYTITTGSPCFLRKVGQAIKWKAINDMDHARQSYELFKNHIVLHFGLILYRCALSSHWINAR